MEPCHNQKCCERAPQGNESQHPGQRVSSVTGEVPPFPAAAWLCFDVTSHGIDFQYTFPVSEVTSSELKHCPNGLFPL